VAAGPYKSVELGRYSRLGLHACRQPSKRGVCKWLYRNSPLSIPIQSRRKHHCTRCSPGIGDRGFESRSLSYARVEATSPLRPGYRTQRGRCNPAIRPIPVRFADDSPVRQPEHAM
jgi:hypothetical protein